MANFLDRTIVVDMNIQPLRLVVHRAHAVGLEDAVFLREVALRKSLLGIALAFATSPIKNNK